MKRNRLLKAGLAVLAISVVVAAGLWFLFVATPPPTAESGEVAPTTPTAVEAGGGSINWSMIGGVVVLFVLVGALLGARSGWI